MSEIKCKRCGKILKSSKSIELQYGSKCFRIMQLEQKKQTKTNEMVNEIQFLRMEINFLKRQFNELKTTQKVVKHTDSIERIKPITKQPETKEQVNFTIVINELKLIFTEDKFDEEDIFDYRAYLRPIEPTSTIKNSPILKEISIIN